MIEQMKPCPWCGGTSVSVVEKEFRYRMAVCDECDAHAPDVRHDTLSKDQPAAERESTARALAQWNERTPV